VEGITRRKFLAGAVVSIAIPSLLPKGATEKATRIYCTLVTENGKGPTSSIDIFDMMTGKEFFFDRINATVEGYVLKDNNGTLLKAEQFAHKYYMSPIDTMRIKIFDRKA